MGSLMNEAQFVIYMWELNDWISPESLRQHVSMERYGLRMTMQDHTSPVRNIETVNGQRYLTVSLGQLPLAGFPLPNQCLVHLAGQDQAAA